MLPQNKQSDWKSWGCWSVFLGGGQVGGPARPALDSCSPRTNHWTEEAPRPLLKHKKACFSGWLHVRASLKGSVKSFQIQCSWLPSGGGVSGLPSHGHGHWDATPKTHSSFCKCTKHIWKRSVTTAANLRFSEDSRGKGFKPLLYSILPLK